MNATHQLYLTICDSDPALLRELEQLVLHVSPDEAQMRLQPNVGERFGSADEPLDYARLYRLLTRDFTGCDLSGEDFSTMHLEGFNFEDAVLKGARLVGANLSGANLTRCDLHRANLSKTCGRGVKAHEVRLWKANLTEADWREADLTYALMMGIEAAGGIFRDAHLNHADVSHAVLHHADLSGALCSYSNFTGADLIEANLRSTRLTCTNMEGVFLYRADLWGCRCDEANFGNTLRISAKTNIDPDNHALISMILLSRAHTLERQQFALSIRYRTDICWAGFTRHLLRQSGETVIWVKEALAEIVSLRSAVEQYESVFYKYLQEYRQSLTLSDIHPLLHDLIRTQIEQNTDLQNADLYWYLRGVLAIVCQRPDMQVDKVQREIVLARLRVAFKQSR